MDRGTQTHRQAGYVEKIAKCRLATRKFLVYGRVVKQATLTPRLKLIQVKCTEFRSYTLETPAVQAYLWEALDGLRGLSCANLTKESQKATPNFTLNDAPLTKGDEDKWSCTKIDEKGDRKSLPGTHSRNVSLPLEFGPYEIKVFKFARQSNPAATKPARKYKFQPMA